MVKIIDNPQDGVWDDDDIEGLFEITIKIVDNNRVAKDKLGILIGRFGIDRMSIKEIMGNHNNSFPICLIDNSLVVTNEAYFREALELAEAYELAGFGEFNIEKMYRS